MVVGDGRVGAWVAGCTLAAVGGERRAAVGAVMSGCMGWVVEWECGSVGAWEYGAWWFAAVWRDVVVRGGVAGLRVGAVVGSGGDTE